MRRPAYQWRTAPGEWVKCPDDWRVKSLLDLPHWKDALTVINEECNEECSGVIYAGTVTGRAP